MPDQIKEKEILIPDSYIDTIEKIMAKFELKETKDEMLKKITEGQDSIREIITQEVARMYKKEATKKTSISMLQQKLGIKKEAAENLAQDLENEIIPILEQINTFKDQIESVSKENEAENETRPNEKERKDTYREPIE
jgi:hypothetical protein